MYTKLHPFMYEQKKIPNCPSICGTVYQHHSYSQNLLYHCSLCPLSDFGGIPQRKKKAIYFLQLFNDILDCLSSQSWNAPLQDITDSLSNCSRNSKYRHGHNCCTHSGMVRLLLSEIVIKSLHTPSKVFCCKHNMPVHLRNTKQELL